jgi:tryptophan halogenase
MIPVQNIVIVGGGTAGWLTAGLIAAKHQERRPHGFTVTLVESPNVPTIGVGEGTWPTLRNSLRRIGVSETELFRQCDAAFKQGARFNGWTTGAEDDGYYHPLMLPQSFGQVNLALTWLADAEEEESFCDMVTPQGRLCDAGLAPKTIATPEYEGLANYAYHLDAGKFAHFLQQHCCEVLGVRHVRADVTEVLLTESGDIQAVATEQAGTIAGDLFVDCTGFSALLIGKALDVPFRSCADTLFCDTALAVQVPHERPDAPIASHTISTAQSAGWIWDIGLPTRRGVGHVFSSAHVDPDEAERALRAYIGPAGDDLAVRRLSIRAGHRERFWKGNCVAVGLAAGFLEPLEASAIVLIELIADQLPPCREVMDVVARRFNDTTLYRWGRIIDFLKLHYALTRRTDSDFWRDNVRPETIPDRLRDLMDLWRYQVPWNIDEFDRAEEVFPSASYQYVLYGMGYRTELVPGAGAADAEIARRAKRENKAQTQRLVTGLPRHRELIAKIVERGLQPV